MTEHSVDALIASDLAALGTENRRDQGSLDALLRSSGVYRDDSAGTEARRDALAHLRRRELATLPLALAHVFARRVARAAAGGAAFVGAIFMLAGMAGAYQGADAVWGPIMPRRALAVAVFANLVLGVYIVATWLAERAFERRMRAAIAVTGDAHADLDRLGEGPLEAGRRLVERADRWAIGLVIAGATASAVMLGAILALGASSARWHGGMQAVAHNAELLATVAAGGLIVALGLAHACRQERWAVQPAWWMRLLSHWAVPVVAVSALIYVVGHADEAVQQLSARSPAAALPDLGWRLRIAIGGGLAVLALVSWAVLAWRRREHARLDEV